MAKIREDLVGSVLVDNPEGGDAFVLVAGDKVPKGVELGDHVLAPKGSGKDGASTTPAGSAEGAATGTEGAQTGNGDTPVPVPPKSGTGSGTEPWRLYALDAIKRAGLQIDIPADASKGDIIAALADAKIATE